ncbi:hypothetical protein AGMMS49992_16850 [Clostridia bacterium]|nr:hypothetical protein AGMMS49992_16850 [Clostridia bacterium]
MEPIDKLRLMLGKSLESEETDSIDDLLSEMLDDARCWMSAYTGQTTWIDELPDEVIGIQIRVASAIYNQRGLEGSNASSVGGVVWNVDALPQHVVRALNRYRLGKVVNLHASPA